MRFFYFFVDIMRDIAEEKEKKKYVSYDELKTESERNIIQIIFLFFSLFFKKKSTQGKSFESKN